MQECFGYLDETALRFVAAVLRVPLSRVYGAATFYHFFTLKPKGKHTCVVCTGTACYIKGAPQLLSAIERRHGIKPGETTPDGELCVLTARCLGSCGLAPAAVMDSAVLGKIGPDGHAGAHREGHPPMTIEELRKIAETEREAQKKFQHHVCVCIAAGCLSSGADQVRDA